MSSHQTRFINPDYGTQVVKSVEPGAIGTTLVHTVTAGKTLYLFGNEISAYIGGRLFVTDAADVEQYNISLISDTTGKNTVRADRKRALVIPAGYKIKYQSTSAHPSSAIIEGVEE